jgi:hypothetical protein
MDRGRERIKKGGKKAEKDAGRKKAELEVIIARLSQMTVKSTC